MEQGRFAYRANLESARKARLDRGDTEFATPDATQQRQKEAQGLMRPRARPQEENQSLARGFGMGLMDAMAPEESPRPQARPTNDPLRDDSGVQGMTYTKG